MRHVGVLRLSIGDAVVLDQEEVDEEDIDMHTALLRATNADCVEAVELLLSLGADPNSTSKCTGTTPLIIACDRRSTRIATMLLSAHANVNLQDGKGWTPLMVACHSDTASIDMVKLLVHAVRSRYQCGRRGDQNYSIIASDNKWSYSNSSIPAGQRC